MTNRKLFSVLAGVFLLTSLPTNATKFLGLRVIDQEYLMVHFRDGEVHYRDNGTGPSAYLGHSFSEGDDTLLVFGTRLDTKVAQQVSLWKVSSTDDPSFVAEQPLKVWRKSKPMNTDHTLTSELDHWLFLQLPKPMRQGCTYQVSLPSRLGADVTTANIKFDVWNEPSEALHVNILGYSPKEVLHAADLYLWLGDGGQRNYKAWEGRQVYLYKIDTKEKQAVGTVQFWKQVADATQEAGGKNLVGTDVWNIDFQGSKPGRYRLVVEGIGCSMDFDIAENVYYEPYRYSVRGYYYMRLGEPKNPEHVFPIPRQPQFIHGTDPKGLTIYKTDLHPWHPEWRKLRMDVWDEPHFKPAKESLFWQHRLAGNPVNPNVTGGHSDAFDWDRHLAHVSNIYDMLLPYILSEGKLSEDQLGIRESGNGIPDLMDEARNEVDFFLSIRDDEGYSQGVTNPCNDWSVMFQAGCTTMAAWANAANCAIMAEAFRLYGIRSGKHDSLRKYYTDEAIKAFHYASRQENQQLDDLQDVGSMQMRGRDFRQMAAAFLYNVTGDVEWEKIMVEESMIKDDKSLLFNKGRQGYFGTGVTNQFNANDIPFCQLWAAAAYLTCPHERHFPEFYEHLKVSVNAQAEVYNLSHMTKRPSRRSANDSRWQVSQNLQLVMLAHYMTTDTQRRSQLEHAMYTEAGWALGRNPGNIVEMTGLGQRHITDVYSTGRNDGDPGTHPGQTPFNGTETWSPNDGGDARILLNRCYPSWQDGGWPRQESYFNQRYMWVNGEFTPRETMRGKMALLGYLHALSKGGNNERPPLTPAWALGHIVWEDSVNNTAGAEELVNGYLKHKIPVDGIIIDSPWSTSYNDFNWDSQRYADPAKMIQGFSQKGVRTILWLTGNVNEKCKDTPQQKSATYDEVISNNYGVDNSKAYTWWKGVGQHIDFTNDKAKQWWYKQLDKVFTDGVYGWKTDQGEQHLPASFDTSKGRMTNEQFRHYYYDAMYDYTISRKRDGIIIARPFSHQGGLEASVGKMSLGWCGDFTGSWKGLKHQIDNIYRSARYGYGAIACEVGGFWGDRCSAQQLTRYAQFGSMTAAMINGGENGAFTNHLPWWHGKKVEKAYRQCVILMKQLVPYKFSTLVDAHLQGGSLLKNTNLEEESHQLGNDLFTKAITSDDSRVTFHLPVDGEWINYWTGERHQGGTQITCIYPLHQFPLFVRAGAILPLAIDNGKEGVTFHIFPVGSTKRTFHLPQGDGTDYFDCTVSYDEQSRRVTIDAARSATFAIQMGSKTLKGEGTHVEVQF